MALFEKLRNNGTLSLQGQPGPNFENEGQRASSNIQALTKNNVLVDSQDLVSGRTYGNSSNRVKISPSTLDLNGTTPEQYTNTLGNSNKGATFYSSTGTGFTLDKRLPFSNLGLGGNPGPNFENEGQRTTSNIQAKTKANNLESSQDLINGRKYGTGRFTVFVPPSALDISGNPFYIAANSTYKTKGPREGRY